MRILVIGGTQFVGRHMVASAIERGHDVTLFHRGMTGDDLFSEATHLHGDRNSDLNVLENGEWDVTLDVCAYFPRHVHELAGALDGWDGRYVLVSTISVYADPPQPGIDEDAPLRGIDDPATEEITGDTYGGLKVLCEAAAHERFGEILTIRPSYVVGPHDHTGRFTRWVTRIAEGGEVLAPGPRDDPMQVIDARDMARWTIELIEKEATGTFHAMSPPPPFTMADMLEAIAAAVAPPGHQLVWVDADFLKAEGVDESVLPLWGADDPQKYVLAADPARAMATGLSPRPLAQTIRETLEWATSDPNANRGNGLERARESDVLRKWRER
jgi:2'-hydroxyisoflavone reductase